MDPWLQLYLFDTAALAVPRALYPLLISCPEISREIHRRGVAVREYIWKLTREHPSVHLGVSRIHGYLHGKFVMSGSYSGLHTVFYGREELGVYVHRGGVKLVYVHTYILNNDDTYWKIVDDVATPIIGANIEPDITSKSRKYWIGLANLLHEMYRATQRKSRRRNARGADALARVGYVELG